MESHDRRAPEKVGLPKFGTDLAPQLMTLHWFGFRSKAQRRAANRIVTMPDTVGTVRVHWSQGLTRKSDGIGIVWCLTRFLRCLSISLAILVEQLRLFDVVTVLQFRA